MILWLLDNAFQLHILGNIKWYNVCKRWTWKHVERSHHGLF